jgi:Tfp pilus assembly protein PilO
MVQKLLNYLDVLQMDKKKSIIVLIAVCVIIYLDFAFVIKAQLKAVAGAGGKISNLKKDIELIKKDLTFLQQDTQKNKGPAKLLKIYSQSEIPLLLQEISVIANDENIKVMEINPSKDTRVKDKSSKVQDFVSLTIKLDLTGGYHNLGSFLNQLENGVQPIFAEEIKIWRNPQDYLKQRVSLILKTYVKK